MKKLTLLILLSIPLIAVAQDKSDIIPKNQVSASMYLNPLFVKDVSNNPGRPLFNPTGGYSGNVTYSRYFKLTPENYFKVGVGIGSETNTYVVENIGDKGLRQSIGTWYMSIPIHYEHFWTVKEESDAYLTTGVGVETNFYYTDGGLTGSVDQNGDKYVMLIKESDERAQYIPTLSIGGVRRLNNNNMITISLIKRFNTSYHPFYALYSVNDSTGIKETGTAYTTVNQLLLSIGYLFGK